MPDSTRQALLLFVGMCAGVQFTRERLRELGQVALPAGAVVATSAATGLLLGWVLSKVAPLDLIRVLLGIVRGGANTMAIIAHDLGAEIRLVAAPTERQLVMVSS